MIIWWSLQASSEVFVIFPEIYVKQQKILLDSVKNSLSCQSGEGIGPRIMAWGCFLQDEVFQLQHPRVQHLFL